MPKYNDQTNQENQFHGKVDQDRKDNHAYPERPDHLKGIEGKIGIEKPPEVYNDQFNKHEPESTREQEL